MDGLYLVHAPEPLTFDNLENTRLYCYFSADLSELQRSFQSRATPGRAWSPPEPENFLTSKAKTLVVAAFSLWRGGEIKDAIMHLHQVPQSSQPPKDTSLDARPSSSAGWGAVWISLVSHTQYSVTQYASITTPAMLTRKVSNEEWAFGMHQDAGTLHPDTKKSTLSWEANPEIPARSRNSAVASCLNQRGFWVILSSGEALELYCRLHGQQSFELEHSAQIKGDVVGCVSSWVGSPRIVMKLDKQILEYTYDGEKLEGPAVIEDGVEGLKTENIAVELQKETDTPEGHVPETVTVAYKIAGPKVLTSFWTNDMGLWMSGEPILE